MKELLVVTVVLLVVLLVVVLTMLWLSHRQNYDTMSIKESLDLTGLPIITFLNGKNKFNFLLDTGATDSLITKRAFDRMTDKKQLPYTGEVLGLSGDYIPTEFHSVGLVYKNSSYVMTFQVMDNVRAFEEIKKDTGVEIHGILGTSFLDKYSYVVDFNEYITYSKKHRKK